MSKMELTREQIEKFVEIYDHFKEIKCFTVEHTEDGEFLITFNMNDVDISPRKDHQYLDLKKFKLDPALLK